MPKYIYKLQRLFFGVTFLYFGIKIINDPIIHSARYNRMIDLRPFEWPFGLSLIVVGLLLLYFRNKVFKSKKEDE